MTTNMWPVYSDTYFTKRPLRKSISLRPVLFYLNMSQYFIFSITKLSVASCRIYHYIVYTHQFIDNTVCKTNFDILLLLGDFFSWP